MIIVTVQLLVVSVEDSGLKQMFALVVLCGGVAKYGLSIAIQNAAQQAVATSVGEDGLLMS